MKSQRTTGKPPRNSQSRPYGDSTPFDVTENSGDTSSEFFSPPSALDQSVLPRNHDTSWIGARQSPILSFDDEEESPSGEMDEESQEGHCITIQNLEHVRSSLQNQLGYNEKSHLLEHGEKRHPEYSAVKQSSSEALPDNTSKGSKKRRRKSYYKKWKWGDVLIVITGSLLFIITLYDVASLYRNRDEYSVTENWIALLFRKPRNANTIIKFGGIDSNRILYKSQYWRILSSMVICASFPEWTLLSFSWMVVIYRNPTFLPNTLTWLGTFFLSAVVGQLWMMAWDREAQTAGSATWGTCGVLTSFGIDRPGQRDYCFLVAALFTLQSWMELPCNSVFGVTGACFFGWILSATSAPVRLIRNHTPRPSSHVRMLLLLSFIVVPITCIAFREPLDRDYSSSIYS